MKENAVSSLPFWKDLTLIERARCEKVSYIKSYKKGETVLNAGDNCLGLTFVIKGNVRVYILSEEGREITLFNFKDGEECLFSAKCVFSQLEFETFITSQEDTTLLIVPAYLFSQIMRENIRVKCFILEQMTEHFSSVMNTMQEIIFLRYDKRLATFLLNNTKESNTIKMTQEEIATATNSAREVVARMLKHFESDELIEYRRGQITIVDREGLKELL